MKIARCSPPCSVRKTASRSASQALRKNGRIIFVGAGTSGRLGVLESAEMPPTFGTDPDLVQAIMAGGKNAVYKAREGVEDPAKLLLLVTEGEGQQVAQTIVNPPLTDRI